MKRLLFMLMAVLLASTVLFGYSCAKEEATEDEKAVKATGETVTTDENSAALAEKKRLLEEAKKEAEKAKELVIAKVNGAEISMYNLVRAMNKMAPQHIKPGQEITEEQTEAIKQEALDRLIFEELAVQEAVRQGINPQAEEIDKVVAAVKENLGSEEAYKQYLDNFGFNEETFRKQIERSHRFELINAREIYGKVEVDEALVKEAYEQEKAKFMLPEKYLIEDVFFIDGKTDALAVQKAEKILATIKSNGNDVWKLVQDGSFIVRTIFVKQEKYPEIHKTMAGMQEGDLSGVIKEESDLHIFKVKKKEAARQSTFEEAKNVIEPRFRVPAQDKRRADWEAELRKDAKIEVMLEEVEKQLQEQAEQAQNPEQESEKAL